MEEEKIIDLGEVEKALIRDVLEHPDKYTDEAKLILVVETWNRQGEAFSDYQCYEILAGDVREVVLFEYDEGYPYRRGSRVAIIPLSLPTVIDLYRYSDTVDPPEKKRILYIFTSEGWKSVEVY